MTFTSPLGRTTTWIKNAPMKDSPGVSERKWLWSRSVKVAFGAMAVGELKLTPSVACTRYDTPVVRPMPVAVEPLRNLDVQRGVVHAHNIGLLDDGPDEVDRFPLHGLMPKLSSGMVDVECCATCWAAARTGTFSAVGLASVPQPVRRADSMVATGTVRIRIVGISLEVR